MQSSSWIRTQKFGCWKYKVAQTNSAIFDEQQLYTTTFDMIYVQAFIQALFYLQISEVETQSYPANIFFIYIGKQKKYEC